MFERMMTKAPWHSSNRCTVKSWRNSRAVEHMCRPSFFPGLGSSSSFMYSAWVFRLMTIENDELELLGRTSVHCLLVVLVT